MSCSTAEKRKADMDVYELLKTEVGLSRVEVDKYFIVTENAKETVLKLRGKAWLETKTYAAMQEIVKKHGGAYHKTPPTFIIPSLNSSSAPAEPQQEEPKSADSEPDAYDLKESVTGLGELAPILKDAHGNIIDGFHRKDVDPDWTSVTVGTVDNPVKLEMARLAVNFCRRRVPPEEMRERIVFLVGKAGLKPEEIAAKTGISIPTIYRYMPQELKDHKKSEAAKTRAVLSRDSTNIKSQDTPLPRDVSVPEPVTQEGAFKETPSFKQIQESYLRELVECDSCHCYAHQTRVKVVDGRQLCPNCVAKNEKPAVEAPQPSSVVDEPAKPKPVKEIDYTSQGKNCPLCGRGMNPETYERIKQKYADKYGGLFA
jgi:hypothetical protein